MTQSQLHAAHALIEQGRIDEARRLLETLDDPTARQWLAQLNTRKRPARRTNAVPLPLLIGVAVVIGIGALIVILLLTPTLLSRLQNGSIEARENAAAAEEAFYAALVHFCTMTTGYGGDDACMDWTDGVLSDHRAAAERCLAASGVETPEQRAQMGICLADAGVPPPF